MAALQVIREGKLELDIDAAVAIESALRPITAKVIVTSRAVEARTPRPLHWLRVKSRP